MSAPTRSANSVSGPPAQAVPAKRSFELQSISAAVLAALAGAFAAFFPTYDPDVFFHLAVGREIALNGLSSTEPFSFASAGNEFVNHEWLFERLLWSFHQFAGLDGVVIFKSTLSSALLTLVFLLARRMGAGPWRALFASIAFLPLIRDSLEARPHLLAYTILVAQTLAVWPHPKSTAPTRTNWKQALIAPAFLVLTTALWANVHGSFPLAAIPFVLWASVEQPPFSKRSRLLLTLTVALALLGATMANPWGFKVLVTVIHHAEPAYRALVPEWAGLPWGEEPVRDLLFASLVLATTATFMARTNTRNLRSLLWFIAGVTQATLSVKFLPGLFVSAIPVLSAQSSAWKWTKGRLAPLLALASVVTSLGAGAVLYPGTNVNTGMDPSQFPVTAISHAEKTGIGGHFFNPFNVGGYIEYAGTSIRPLIDGRAYVHGLTGIKAYLAALADPSTFSAMNRRYRFSAILTDLLDPSFPRLTEYLTTNRDWVLVHVDDRFAIFVPNDSDVLKNTDVSAFLIVKPLTDPRYIFDLNPADLARARSEADVIISRGGGDIMGHLVHGSASLAMAGVGHEPDKAINPLADKILCAQAVGDFTTIRKLRPDVPVFSYFLAIAQACCGDCLTAKKTAEETPFADAHSLAKTLAKQCP